MATLKDAVTQKASISMGSKNDYYPNDPGTQSRMAIFKTVHPFMKRVFDPTGVNVYDQMPNLYDTPELNINLPNIQDYMAGGQTYQNAYNQLAPTFWESFQENVENPLIARFSGAGTLGSPVAGVSGAAMDALLGKRGAAEAQIAAQAHQSAQTPLMAAYSSEANAALQEAVKPWEANVEELQYPYQILPGVLGGSMPAQVVKQPAPEGGGGK